MSWERVDSDSLPDIREPVWAYGCDGSLLLVCLVYEENINSEWNLGADHQVLSWCVLRDTDIFSSGEIIPFSFITHITEFDASSPDDPVQPKVHV